MIDITMTSTCRPELLHETLFSFKENLFSCYDDCRLVINIDCTPGLASTQSANDMLENVIYKFFKKKNVIYRICETPNFSDAVIWCYNNVSSEYVFHLEDDWNLTSKVNLEKALSILKENPEIASVRMLKDMGKYKDVHYRDGAGAYYVLNNRHSLNPSLFRGEYIKGLVGLMRNDHNPEIQVSRPKDKIMKRYTQKWTYVLLNHRDNPIVKDIGIEWRKTRSLVKDKNGRDGQREFLRWKVK